MIISLSGRTLRHQAISGYLMMKIAFESRLIYWNFLSDQYYLFIPAAIWIYRELGSMPFTFIR